MPILEWNTAGRAQREGQRQQEALQRARAETQRRDALRAQLPGWRQTLAAIGPAIETAEAEAARLDAEKDAAYAKYYFAYFRQTGGNSPTQGSGEVVLLAPMPGQAGVELPAVREWEAYQKAEQAATEGHRHLRGLDADRRALMHNITLGEQA